MNRQYTKIAILILSLSLYNCGKDYETLYHEALELKSRGQYDESLAKLKLAAEKKETAEVNKEIANYYIEYARDYDTAEKFLKKSLELNPDYPNAMHNMGLLYLKKYEESLENKEPNSYLQTAEEWLKKNIQQHPDFGLTYAEYGMVLFYKNNYQQGIDNIQLSIQKGANKSYAHLLMGKIYYFGFKNFPEALNNLNMAYNDFNNDSYLLRLLALTHDNLNHADQARQFYKRYIKSLQDNGAPEPMIKKALEEESRLRSG